ncbi:MAG: family 43 glycosylhydrolase [Lachnospiraceae bacterium]|nr:family 43 glycosylhydrolase [Lachnospiraceae bacterium]
MTITEGTVTELTGKASVTLNDGSKIEDARVHWYDEDGNQVLSTENLKEGVHTLKGKVSYFDNPVIKQRADPYVIYNEDDGCYYFTSSWPAYNDAEHGYDRIALRKSPSLSGIRNAGDHVIWEARSSGAQSHHVWAPELHKINGIWYIYYATTCQSDIWSIRPYVLMCTDPDDLLNPDKWVDKGRFLDKDGKEAGLFGSFSLDMTYFENLGKHYVIWAYKGFYPGAVPGSLLLMAEIDENEPWKLSSDPILLSEPEYDWEQVGEKVNEGPAVLKHDGKIYVTYSASATGPEYCMGLLSADADADLMDAGNWKKSEKPVLSSGDFTDQYGPGHNSFTTDESGNTIIVYHSRDQRCYDNECDWAEADPLYDPCRNANFAYVRFTGDGTPVFNSTEDKETAGLDISITITVNSGE